MARLILLLAALLLLPVAPAQAAGQPNTWNFRQATVPEAQRAGHYGAGVTVAVIDSWVDNQHPDFAGRLLPAVDCIGWCEQRPVTGDYCEHGTHVAGTVASETYGVAPKARILPIRVLRYDSGSEDCTGSADDVAQAIRWATSKRVGVINLSVGGLIPGLGQSTAVTEAVAEAAAAGVVVIFAAGNSTIPLTDDYGSDALIVAATAPGGGLASYSQRAASVDLAAPGGDSGVETCREANCIASTVLDRGYGLLQGTSMAAPHVSGVAALLLAQLPQRGRDDVLAALRSTARPLPGAGAGRLDAAAALRYGSARVPKGPAAAPPPEPAPVEAGEPLPAPPAQQPVQQPAQQPSRPPRAAAPDTAVSLVPQRPGGSVPLGQDPPPTDDGGGGSSLPVMVAGALLAALGFGAFRAANRRG